ncbi:MAG: penicillin-binding protein 1C [Lentisphaeria bacterium]|nr:penicillin-binding protein 1C [Lentisphaeria bacterium]
MGALLGAAAGAGVCRWARPRQGVLPATPASPVILDRSGRAIRVELDSEQQWRFPVPITRVSPWVVQAVVAAEDKRFWTHRGIDWIAAARAAVTNLFRGRVVSGASTLTMQVARLGHPEPRGWGAKARQALRARAIERQYPKCRVLEQYLNRAPFGGNVVGIEAAARVYFGKSAAQLNLCEAALLAGLPQRPAALRPDRYPERSALRRRTVLRRMQAAGMIDGARGDAAERSPPGVLGSGTAAARQVLPRDEAVFCAFVMGKRGVDRGGTLRTTLDPVWQQAARTALQSGVAALPGVADGAAVLIDNRTGAVRALVGSLDVNAPRTGWVNAATRPRSPGSALKPFLYAAAIDGGLVVPETRLWDTPLTLPEYRPGNFDGQYHGSVSAGEALACSLNTPAVRLAQRLGPVAVRDRMIACGLRSLERSAEDPDLGLVLGAADVSLLELTAAYAGLARGGHFSEPRILETDPPAEGGPRPFTAGTVTLVTDMLSRHPLPGAPGLPVAWKTGTSAAHRDAWCIAYNAEVTVGVWLGNKSGRPAAGLVGIRAAAPVAGDILTRICRPGTPPLPPPRGTVAVRLCRRSGLAATPDCPSVHFGLRPESVPLRPCPLCCVREVGGQPRPVAITLRQEDTNPRIRSPQPGTYVAGNDPPRLCLEAAHSEPLLWFLDGQYLGRFARRYGVEFPRGDHALTGIRDGTGQQHAIRIRID